MTVSSPKRRALTPVNAINTKNDATAKSSTKQTVPNDTWESKVSSVRKWLESSPALPDDGSLVTIKAQLDRGDASPESREKAWVHVLLEIAAAGNLQALGFVIKDLHDAVVATTTVAPVIAATPDGAENKPPATINTPAGGTGSRAVLALRSVTGLDNAGADSTVADNTSGSNLTGDFSLEIPAITGDLEKLKSPNGAPVSVSARALGAEGEGEISQAGLGSLSDRGPGGFIVSNVEEPKKPLTMMERQALWMKRKEAKVKERQQEAEAEITKTIVGKPNIGRSKKSFGVVQKVRGEQEKAREAMEKMQAAATKEKAVENAVKKFKKGAKKAKAKKDKGKEDKGKEDKASKALAAAEEAMKNEEERKKMFSPTTAMARRREGSGASAESEAFTLEKSTSEPALKSPVPGASGEALPVEEPKVTEEPFTEGSFFTRVDESSGRGHYRVRNGGGFQMSTMYRKRDRNSRKGSAVALLVGREESWPNAEKVIEVLFDKDKMSERECMEWWKENQGRFASPRPEDSENK